MSDFKYKTAKFKRQYLVTIADNDIECPSNEEVFGLIQDQFQYDMISVEDFVRETPSS